MSCAIGFSGIAFLSRPLDGPFEDRSRILTRLFSRYGCRQSNFAGIADRGAALSGAANCYQRTSARSISTPPPRHPTPWSDSGTSNSPGVRRISAVAGNLTLFEILLVKTPECFPQGPSSRMPSAPCRGLSHVHSRCPTECAAGFPPTRRFGPRRLQACGRFQRDRGSPSRCGDSGTATRPRRQADPTPGLGYEIPRPAVRPIARYSAPTSSNPPRRARSGSNSQNSAMPNAA